MQPTAQDHENARIRQAIADRQNAEYHHCLRLALGALGPGWTPWMRLQLVESDYHLHRDRPPVVAATVFKVYRGEERLTETSMYLREADGKILKARTYEELFGDLLHEKHPTYGFKKDGRWVAFDRWSVCWSALELYHPRTAEDLAALRVSREQKKAEREEKAWQEENPLLAWAGLRGPEKE